MTNHMKVAFVVPYINIGGVETFIFQLITELSKYEIDSYIVVTASKGEWFEYALRNGFKCHYISPNPFVSLTRHARRVSNYINSNNFSCLFLNNDKILQMALQFIDSRIARFPVVHNDRLEIYNIAFSNSSAWNALITISPKIYNECLLRFCPEKLCHIPHGVTCKDEVINQREYSDEFRIIFIGRIEHKQKGVLFLPEILNNCIKVQKNIKLYIVGDGPDRKLLESNLAKNGLQEYCQFFGRVNHSEIRDILASCHLLLMPSFYEGFPIVPLEAMACGCVPVLSFLDGITNAIVSNDEDGMLVTVGKTVEFARIIIEFDADRSKWSKFSKASFLKIRNKYSSQLMGEHYYNVINSSASRYPMTEIINPQMDYSLMSKGDKIAGIWQLKKLLRYLWNKFK